MSLLSNRLYYFCAPLQTMLRLPDSIAESNYSSSGRLSGCSIFLLEPFSYYAKSRILEMGKTDSFQTLFNPEFILSYIIAVSHS